jgi:hypothetical protein
MFMAQVRYSLSINLCFQIQTFEDNSDGVKHSRVITSHFERHIKIASAINLTEILPNSDPSHMNDPHVITDPILKFH